MVAAVAGRGCRTVATRLPTVSSRLPRSCPFRRNRRLPRGCRPSGNRQETVTTAVDGWRRLLIVVALKLSVIVCSGDRLAPSASCQPSSHCALNDAVILQFLEQGFHDRLHYHHGRDGK